MKALRFPEARNQPRAAPMLPTPEPEPPPPLPATTFLPAVLETGATVDLLGMVLAGLKEQSRQGYVKDLRALAGFLGLSSPGEAVGKLLTLDRGSANALSAAWLSAMLLQELSPSTVRRRYAALCRVYKAGRRFNLTDVMPEAELPRTQALRDTAGPGKRGWERMLSLAEREASTGTAEALRNLAIVLLLHDRGLRRGEVEALDWPGDVDALKPAVFVLGKGRLEKVWLTVSDRSAESVRAWLTARGDEGGPLFTRCDNAIKTPERLLGHGINDLVKALGRRAELPRTVRAHGLRHQAITEALDRGWSIRNVMQFSRHLDPRVLDTYDDRRADVGGEISRSLGGERRPPRPKR
jgi:integrase